MLQCNIICVYPYFFRPEVWIDLLIISRKMKVSAKICTTGVICVLVYSLEICQ